jgi:acetyl-CoA carboxylase biotin carboxylase subunit
MTASCAGAVAAKKSIAATSRINFLFIFSLTHKSTAPSYTANDWARKSNRKRLRATTHAKILLHGKPAMFRKILIANRGEIAVRILRACRELGIRSVAVFSDVDRKSLHVRLADEAYPIGPAPSRESYLRIDRIIDLARRSGCDAVHPGYGFLAENPALPRACADAGITFIGPPAEAMESLGSKTAARQLARRADVPTVPGTNDPIEKPVEAQALAQGMGYPVLLKAVSGGGGKGMRLVHSDAEFDSGFRDASSEAMNAFGDDRLYLEKYLERPHHVEIQIFADNHGRVVSLGERECSVQRRHQKVIEEAPSPIVTPDLRKKMGEAAVRLARASGYVNAGTVEFLVDANLNFYFLEVNTRLQVEHPVTEQVTGLDLVKLQIAIAAGHRLPFAWESITPRGHAMEVRLYAEDPDNNFFPSPGKILSRKVPSGPGIRLDDGVYEGWTVPNDYDPLLSKLIAWGNSREETIARLRRALEEYTITGIKTNAGLFRRILTEPDFLRGEIHTMWLDELLRRPISVASAANRTSLANTGSDAVAVAAAIWQANQWERHSSVSSSSADQPSHWKREGRREQMDRLR